MQLNVLGKIAGRCLFGDSSAFRGRRNPGAYDHAESSAQAFSRIARAGTAPQRRPGSSTCRAPTESRAERRGIWKTHSRFGSDNRAFFQVGRNQESPRRTSDSVL